MYFVAIHTLHNLLLLKTCTSWLYTHITQLTVVKDVYFVAIFTHITQLTVVKDVYFVAIGTLHNLLLLKTCTSWLYTHHTTYCC